MDSTRLLPDMAKAIEKISYVEEADFDYHDDTILITNKNGSIFRLKLETIKD